MIMMMNCHPLTRTLVSSTLFFVLSVGIVNVIYTYNQKSISSLLSQNQMKRIITPVQKRKAFFVPVPNLKLSQELYTDMCLANPTSIERKNDTTDSIVGPVTLLPTNYQANNIFHSDTNMHYRHGIKAVNMSLNSLSRPWIQLPNVRLVIIFHEPYYSVIPHLELLYRPFFPDIIYCGPQWPDESIKPLAPYRIRFVRWRPSPPDHWQCSFNYECVALAAAVARPIHYPPLDGYLVVSDDVLILQPTLTERVPLDAFWLHPPEEIRVGNLSSRLECHNKVCNISSGWIWWAAYSESAMHALDELSKTDHPKDIYRRCYNQLIKIYGGKNIIEGGYSDFYYIPVSGLNDFIDVSSIFLDNQIFMELAVPTILRCLASDGHVWEKLVKQSIWSSERNDVWNNFDHKYLAQNFYLHPTKWSRLTKPPQESSKEATLLRNVFCRYILPHLHDPLGHLPARKKS